MSATKSARVDPAAIRALSQYPTPQWLAERIIEHYFSDLTSQDFVIEPSCHLGHFLSAIPANVPAIGIELDPCIAREAQRLTGREVIAGDFLSAPITRMPTAIVGNPPFRARLIEAFLQRSRALLPDGGRVGFLLPVYIFQSTVTALRLSEGWRVEHALVPRDVYPRLKLPLLFAQMTKARERTLVSFAFYEESAAIRALSPAARQTLAKPGGSAWQATALRALTELGGRAKLPQIYAWAEGRRPTANQFWREKLRQALQQCGVRVGRGEWALPSQASIAF